MFIIKISEPTEEEYNEIEKFKKAMKLRLNKYRKVFKLLYILTNNKPYIKKE